MPETSKGDPAGNGRNLPGPGQTSAGEKTDPPAIEPPLTGGANPLSATCPPWCTWTALHGTQDEVRHYSVLHQIDLSLEPVEEMIGNGIPEPPVPAVERVWQEPEPHWFTNFARDHVAVYLAAGADLGDVGVTIDRSSYGESLVHLSLTEARQLADALTGLLSATAVDDD